MACGVLSAYEYNPILHRVASAMEFECAVVCDYSIGRQFGGKKIAVDRTSFRIRAWRDGAVNPSSNVEDGALAVKVMKQVPACSRICGPAVTHKLFEFVRRKHRMCAEENRSRWTCLFHMLVTIILGLIIVKVKHRLVKSTR